MYDDRTNLTRQVAADLAEFFEDEVFKTVIPRSVRLAEAPKPWKADSSLRRPVQGRRKLYQTRERNPRK